MLSKCANPTCSARFLYLNEGKIFNVESGITSEGTRLNHRIEHFWLCGNCARTLRVVRENREITVRPLHLALPEGDTTAEKKDAA